MSNQNNKDMEKSVIPNGLMFIHFDSEHMERPKVWVKVSEEKTREGETCSLFVDNDFIIQNSINPKRVNATWRVRWNITDKYYGQMVREGRFVPISDLRETESVCEENGWPRYEIDLGF